MALIAVALRPIECNKPKSKASVWTLRGSEDSSEELLPRKQRGDKSRPDA